MKTVQPGRDPTVTESQNVSCHLSLEVVGFTTYQEDTDAQFTICFKERGKRGSRKL